MRRRPPITAPTSGATGASGRFASVPMEPSTWSPGATRMRRRASSRPSAASRPMRDRAWVMVAALALLGGCGDDETDTAGPGGTLPPRRVFVTSAIYPGNIGGLMGADAKCQTSADAAMLGGSWRAWLSQDGVN